MTEEKKKGLGLGIWTWPIMTRLQERDEGTEDGPGSRIKNLFNRK